MLNKNDPLIGAVQQVMQRSNAEREAVKTVNEKFGIQDRKALPREKQGEWEAAYKQILSEGLHPNQEKLDMNKNNKLDSQDFKLLRKKKPMEESTDGDTTSPSSMGIKKPEYASGTPDYAKPKEQTVNRAEKTSLPPGTMKEAKTLNPYAVGMAAVKKSTGDQPPMEKKNIMKAHKIAKKIIAKRKMNEGFNDRRDSSVTASDENQVVAGQLTEKIGVPLAARQKQMQVKKDATATQQRLAREPKEASSSIGTKIKQGLSATNAAVSGFANQALLGKEIAAAGDYAVKNIGAAVGIGKGTTYGQEYKQEQEKEARMKLNNPTAYGVGDAAGNIANIASLAGATKTALKYGAKKLIGSTVKSSADDAAKVAATAAKPATSAARETSALAKPVSPAAREGGAVSSAANVNKFISKAKSTPVSPSAREGGAAVTSAADKAAANAAKYSKPGTAGGRFSDNLAKARKGSENYGPNKGSVVVRKPTEPVVAQKPGVPAVVKKPGVPAVANRPGLPAVAKRPGLPATVGTASSAAKTSRFGNALKYGAVGAAVGGSGYALLNKNQPPAAKAGPTNAASGLTTGPGSVAPKTTPGTPPKATTQQPVQKKTTTVSSAPVKREPLQTRYQRDNTIGASGKPTQGPGGVTSGTKTGTTITNKPQAVKKAPVGTGRVK